MITSVKEEMKCMRGVLNTPEPQIYLGLMVRIWAGLGLHSSTVSVFYFILSLYMGKICLFYDLLQSKSGVEKFIQYAPECILLHSKGLGLQSLIKFSNGFLSSNIGGDAKISNDFFPKERLLYLNRRSYGRSTAYNVRNAWREADII